MKFIITIITALFFISCNLHVKNQDQESIITSITFFDNNTSVPANFELHKYNQIEIVNDNASLTEYIYKKGKFDETRILNSIKLNEAQKDVFFSIPEEYLKEDKYNIGINDTLGESIFKATITLSNEKKIIWVLSYDKERYPNEIKSFYNFYFGLKKELHKTN